MRFEPDGGRTRLHVQLKYSPPLGVIGNVVAKAFGVDPKSGLDHDLLDLKSLVETGQLPRDGARRRRLESKGSGASA